MGVKLVSSGGGSVEINPPATASSFVATMPAKTGNVMLDGPAFSAFRSTTNQSITAGVTTKVALNGETFDTNNNFDPTTNYRFTPTVEGYYSVYGQIYHGATVTRASAATTSIFKNGSNVATGDVNIATANQLTLAINVSALVYMNGTTDYLELYGSQTGGSGNVFLAGSQFTYFSAFLARGA